jgi:hypothetical protein
MRHVNPDHHAFKNGTTIFLKQVKEPSLVKRILQPAQSNEKLGGIISKGKWKGMAMYSLSLEERKTCPVTCQQWKTCYGNNMPFGNRIKHNSNSFFPTLTSELKSLATKHVNGFVVRLHVLGDFYSVAYVNYWKKQLVNHPNLKIFGYTHRQPGTPIGRSIAEMNVMGAWIRWSDVGGPMSANVNGEGITCPEQTGKTKSCSTCGLCWSTPLAINFLEH